MFSYSFMQRAFLVGILLAAVIPLIGSIVVFKRMSMLGDAISHTSLAGITLGLVIGVNPLAIAIVISVLASLLVEFISRRYIQYKELSLSIVLSLGVALTAIFSSFIDNPGNYNQYLFGSILNITPQDIPIAILLAVFIIVLSVKYYRDFFYIAYDETSAQLAGIKVHRISLIFTIMTSMTVAIASKLLGALVISSLLVLPVAFAILVARSYKQVFTYAIGFSIGSMVLGLTASYYLNLVSGGTIVLSGIIILLLTFMVKNPRL